MMGVPVVHASHAGSFQGFVLPDEKVPYNSHFEGETVIIDGHGQVLARMAYEDGEGIIFADVSPGEVPGPHEPIPDRFWIPELSQHTEARWKEALIRGRRYYDEVTVPHVEMGLRWIIIDWIIYDCLAENRKISGCRQSAHTLFV